MSRATLLWPELVSYLDTLAAPHILVDLDYRILAANDRYRQACAEGTDVVGRTCHQVSHGYGEPCDRMGESCPRARSMASGRREHAVHLHHTPRGDAYESIELAPVRDARGNVVAFVERLEALSGAGGDRAGAALIGASAPFAQMLGFVARVAPSDAAVLLLGASGTGKELVARAIHDASRRAHEPFAVVDCSGLPETLFESEVFGHERGAFTGAVARKQGLVEAASGGTLFLDEVGDIPLGLQVKLLRLLETGTYRRVGGTELLRADVRLVSATNRPLEAMVDEGRFREDLYYRLNTFPIRLPTLAERAADVPLLVAALLKRVAPQRTLAVSPAALAHLVAYDYPGNVRELRNVLEWSALMCDGGTIEPRHLPERVRGGTAPAAASLREIEAAAVRAFTAGTAGTRREQARALGVSERTLYRRLRGS